MVGSGAIGQNDSVVAASHGIAVGGNVGGSVFGSLDSLTIQSAVFLAPPDPGQVSPKHLLWTYLNRVVQETATLDLSGVDRKSASDREAARLELAAMYTELDTVRAEETDRGQQRAKGATIERLLEGQKRQSALAFADATKYAVLLGDPGSGKTTFVNFLALCLAGELLGLEAANLRRLGAAWKQGAVLPVRVVLRDFAAQLPLAAGNPLWSYLVSRLGESLAGFAPLLNRHLLEEGGLLILDGLDEVPEANLRRDQVKQAVLTFRQAYPRLRLLLTSRTYAYQRQQWQLPGFTDAVLAPFSPEQIEVFVDHWYAHMAKVRANLTPETAQGRATLLKQAIARTPHLRELAPRPLLLTLMASLHAWRGGSLPEQREELYEESVDLLLDFWERPKAVLESSGKTLLQTESAAEWFKTSRERVQQELEHLTYEAHRTQPTLEGSADIEEGTLVAALLQASGDPDLKAGRVVEYIRDRAGLLTNRGEGVYGFPHRTFQEYLAARYLTRTGFPKLVVEHVRLEPERWREVLLLAGAKVARGTPFAAWSLVQRLCPNECSEVAAGKAADTDWWAALLAGRLLLETRIHDATMLDAVEAQTLLDARSWLAALVAGGHLPPVDRAAAGVALGRLSDPRPGVGLKNGLPDIVWSDPIAHGRFPMGNDKPEAEYNDEQPRFTCTLILQRHRVSRYPITVAQYTAFVADNGYQNKRFWEAAIAAGRWRTGKVRVYTYPLQGDGFEQWADGPYDYGSPFNLPNHPQVGVSWYEAMACCRWLSEVTGKDIHLPSEAQWERAARHIDGRLYPWGEDDPARHCNMVNTGIGATCAVGIFPTGDAVCGAADMSGNVWEWCTTKWTGNYERYEKKVDDNLQGADRRVLRGGSFSYSPRNVRCAVRGHYDPYDRDGDLGFRVVLSPSTSDL